MLAVVGFGMNAFDPNEPTMLIMICIGVGIGSSNVRSLPPDGDAMPCGISSDGEDGRRPLSQPQKATAQEAATTNDPSFVRMWITASKPSARCNRRYS